MQTCFEQPRAALPFRVVNARGSRHYDPALQRHHLLPRQILAIGGFASMVALLGESRIGVHDFRRNGLLLPAREDAVRRTGLPLHRGPHRQYNAMVIERVARIEASWARHRHKDPGRRATMQPCASACCSPPCEGACWPAGHPIGSTAMIRSAPASTFRTST